MFVLLSLYVVGYFITPLLSKFLYQSFILLSLPIFFLEFKLLKKDYIFSLLLLSIVIQALSWANSLYYYPEFSNDSPKLDRLSKLFSFIFIAYWIKGSLNKVLIVLFLFVFGFSLNVVLSLEFYNDLAILLEDSTKRVDFGFKNSQYTSMLSGVVFLITVFLLFSKPCLPIKYKNIFLSLVSFIMLLSAFILLVSQSRQVWLAFCVVFLCFPLVFGWVYPKTSRLKIFSGYISLFICIFFISKLELVEERFIYTFEYEYSMFSDALNRDKVRSIGNGIRINSWFESVDWIKEHPILGSGPNAIGEVIQQSSRLSNKVKSKVRHLHNFHIELLVAYGIVGLCIIYCMYYCVIHSLFTSKLNNPELTPITIFGVMFLLFWLTVNFFESFSSRSDGVYVQNIVFGCLYTFYFLNNGLKSSSN